MLIIIKGKSRFGKSRSEIESNLRKEWGGANLTPEQIDKCKFLEKRTGAKWFDSELIKQAEKVREVK